MGESITEGAALQQSRGGVETLFKDDADKVKEYADKAFKTAGLSSNAYMETVTGFSASLLQSMANDTSAASEVANMALVDMADNANKFGTDMQDIQNAYQGFAKQNYTMLDNLKLGYGGTQAEMQRLLEDAQALTGVEYDINKLDDVFNAIHAIQVEMDVAGTTAKEASSTFEGSFASMSAAAKNVLGKMSLGEDISVPLKDLGSTISTFLFGNVVPMVTNFGVSLAEAAPDIIFEFAKGLIGSLPTVVQAGAKIGAALLKGIWDMIKDLASEIWNFITAPFKKIGGWFDDKFTESSSMIASQGFVDPSSGMYVPGGDTYNFNVNARDLQEVDGLIRTADNARRIGRMGIA